MKLVGSPETERDVRRATVRQAAGMRQSDARCRKLVLAQVIETSKALAGMSHSGLKSPPTG